MKNILKKWGKKILVLLVLYSLGIGMIMLMCYRAEQINRSVGYEEIN